MIFLIVMPGLVPGIHVFAKKEDVDGRDEPGHGGTCGAERPLFGIML